MDCLVPGEGKGEDDLNGGRGRPVAWSMSGERRGRTGGDWGWRREGKIDGWERSDLGVPTARSWRPEVGREGRERIGKKNLTLYHVGNPNSRIGWSIVLIDLVVGSGPLLRRREGNYTGNTKNPNVYSNSIDLANNIKMLFCVFEQLSGLKNNYHRSDIFYLGQTKECEEQLTPL